ncbi:MAG: 5-oxoprolinase subunit PxpA [Glaciecola sp.]
MDKYEIKMHINCDLGESYGHYNLPGEQALLHMIDQANIACGFHAGDFSHITRTLKGVIEAGVMVGAHPSYPDRQGFGRRSMDMELSDAADMVVFQVATLEGLCRYHGTVLQYVKPHGALYHDMVNNTALRFAVFAAIARFSPALAVVLPAGPWAKTLAHDAESFGLTLWFEVFADRAYAADGQLVSRSQAGAVLDRAQCLAQAKQLITEQSVTTITGTILPMDADTLCVHGDTPDALAMVKDIVSLCPR